MTDRVRQPMDGRRTNGIPLQEVPVPVATEPPNSELQQDQADSQVPQFPAGFVVVDRETGIKVWDVRSGDFVDADDLLADPDGTTVMSGNLIVKGGSIASDNFAEGSAGWEITHDGQAEFNDVSVRGQIVATDGVNLVVNGGAEQPISGWESDPATSPWGVIAQTTTEHRTGSAAFMLSTSVAASALGLRQTLSAPNLQTVVPGVPYRLAAYAKVNDATASPELALSIVFYDNSLSAIGGTHNVLVAGLNTTTYLLGTGTFVAPTNAAYAQLIMGCLGSGGSLATTFRLYVDDLFFGPTSTIEAGLVETAPDGRRVVVTNDDKASVYFYDGGGAEGAPGSIRQSSGDANVASILKIQPSGLTGHLTNVPYVQLKGEDFGTGSAIDIVADSSTFNKPPVVPKVFCKTIQVVAQSIPNGGTTALTFTSDVDDDLAMHDPVTNNTKIFVPYTGLYYCTGQIWYNASTGGSLREAMIRANGTIVWENRQTNAQHAVAQPCVNVSGPVMLSAGDFVELCAFHDAGAALNTLIVAGRGPFLSVALIQRTA